MTTSSNHNSKSPATPRPQGNHWSELSDRIPATPVAQLGDWMDTQLAVLEESQKRFVTSQSLLKSLRR